MPAKWRLRRPPRTCWRSMGRQFQVIKVPGADFLFAWCGWGWWCAMTSAASNDLKGKTVVVAQFTESDFFMQLSGQ